MDAANTTRGTPETNMATELEQAQADVVAAEAAVAAIPTAARGEVDARGDWTLSPVYSAAIATLRGAQARRSAIERAAVRPMSPASLPESYLSRDPDDC